MKKAAIIGYFLVSCLAFSGCVGRNSGDAESEWGNAVKGLQCKLETERSRYALGEAIVVREYIKNSTDKDITICAWPSEETLLFTHYEADKKILKKDRAIFKKPASLEKSFITIKPQSETYYCTRELGEEYFNKGGKWELKILAIFNFTGQEFGLDAWQGELQTNTITVNITSK